MKNIKRKIIIILEGRLSLFKIKSRQRRFALLSKAKSIFDPVYTQKELEYLFDRL